jgi:hypothetical protein
VALDPRGGGIPTRPVAPPSADCSGKLDAEALRKIAEAMDALNEAAEEEG